MAKSRLRSNRAKFKQSSPAQHLGWSKGKTSALVIMMAVLIAFILFVIVALFIVR